MTEPTTPHRRHDPLQDAWVLVSPGRASRPWNGQVEPAPAPPPPYDPTCQLCPGNVRASGIANPAYEGTFAFTNDFPALVDGAGGDGSAVRWATEEGLHRSEGEAGTARVLCFSPRHDRSLGSLPVPEIRSVVDLWADQTAELGQRYPWVQVFENRGEAMGASNPHPHGQVWAGTAVPTEAAREDATQRAHLAATGHALLDDVVAQEVGGPLVVEANDDWLAIVPFWAAWPFETLLLARRPVASLPALDATGRDNLSALLSGLLGRYDGLFGRPFPYSMGWHQAPTVDGDVSHWRLHGHVYPPLLRADARKFMVGYELLAEPQRDLTPEAAAAALRSVEPFPG